MECFSVNPLYLIINKIKDHFEEEDGDKYLIINSEDGDIMQKCQEVFNGIKGIKKINDYNQRIKCDDNYMKIKFNTEYSTKQNYLLPYNNYNNKTYHKKKMINIILNFS